METIPTTLPLETLLPFTETGGTAARDTIGTGYRAVLAAGASLSSDGSGLHLTAEGQYATVTGLLDTYPDAGGVGFTFLPVGNLPASATLDQRIAMKENTAQTGGAGDALDFFMAQSDGAPLPGQTVPAYLAGSLVVRLVSGGTTQFLQSGTRSFPAGVAVDIDLLWGPKLAAGDGAGKHPFRLLINGVLETGSLGNLLLPGNGALAAFTLGAFNNGGTPSNSFRGNISNLRVYNKQVSADVPALNRLGKTLSPSRQQDKWVRRITPVLMAAGTGWEQNVLQEATVRYKNGSYYMTYTGGYAPCAIGRATSPDGFAWTKDANPIVGNGNGGESGGCCRGQLFTDADGTDYLFYANGDGQNNSDIKLCRLNADMTVAANLGTVLTHGGFNSGLCNTKTIKVGSVYHMFVDVTIPANAAHFLEAHATASSVTGPYTFTKQDYDHSLTIAGGTFGGLEIKGPINARYYCWGQGGLSGPTPTEIYCMSSPDLSDGSWGLVSYDPVLPIRVGTAEVDQCADLSICETSAPGAPILGYYEGFDNVAQRASIMVATYAGTLTSLVTDGVASTGGGTVGGTPLALSIVKPNGIPVLTWTPDPSATVYKILRSVAAQGGQQVGQVYSVVAVVAQGTYTWTDNNEPIGLIDYAVVGA